MNLLDFVQLLDRKRREALSFLKNPQSQIMQFAYRQAQEKTTEQLQRFQIHESSPATKKQSTNPTVDRQPLSEYYQATVDRDNQDKLKPVQQTTAQVLSPQIGRSVEKSLTKGQEIQGRRDRYQIDELIKESADQSVRIYRAIQRLNHRSVWLKEYRFAKQLSSQQIQQRKEQLEQLSRINLTNSRRQDFRLVTPYDTAFSEKCYYVITEALNGSTLKDYLDEKRAMAAVQVHQILIQVLQTLWFLHSQKIRLPSGAIQQVVHGNLNLNSLFRVPQVSPLSVSEPQFLIYVCNLGLWESLLRSPSSSTIPASVAQDLKALGYVGFNLLTNARLTSTETPFDFKGLEPELIDRWDAIDDRPLKQVILQLLGVIRPTFANAFNAREALLKPPPEREASAVLITEAEPAVAKSSPWLAFLTLLLFGLIAGLGFLAVRSLLSSSDRPKIEAPSGNCQGCLNRVSGVPSGKISYVVETGGSWAYALTRSGLVGSGELAAGNTISGAKTLMTELKQREPRLRQYIRKQFVRSPEDAIQQVRSGQASFALISVLDSNAIPVDLKQEVVAYDALAVFVPNGAEIPRRFNNGTITFGQLWQVFTNTHPWDVPNDLEGWSGPIKYIPFESRAIDLFQQQVFGNFLRGNLEQEKAFLNLKNAVLQRQRSDLGNPEKFLSTNLFGQMLEGTKKNQLGVGFAPLSLVFGQCSVYPLAVSRLGQAVQPLVQENQQPIDPDTDLCNSKGNYHPDQEKIRSRQYPLSYSLVVVYPEAQTRSLAGQKFVELLRTDEGQCLLSEAGLVAQHPCPQP